MNGANGNHGRAHGAALRRQLRPRAALILAAALVTLGSFGLAAANAPTRAQAPGGTYSSCAAIVKATMPSRLALVGSRTGVTTALTPICTGESYPLHVVLVLDGSSSMAGQSTDTVKRLAHAWVDSFDLSNNPAITVAVVEINQPSKRLCGPSRSAWDINNCIDRLSANGGSDIAGALRLGLRAIDDGRGSAVDRDSIREVMLVLTDGGNSDGCAPVLSVAGQAKGQGVLMTTACVTAGCDDSCLRSAATSPRYFFAVDQLDSITGMFETLRNWYQNIIIKTAALTETISSTFAWIDGSARPEPRAWHGQRIAWWYTHVPRDGITMTIGLQPLSPALDVPVFSDVGSQLVDNKGRAVAPTLDVPRVDVLDARFGAPPAPLTATVPISNHLTVDAPRAFVGQRLRAHYHLELPSGDARRLNVAMIQLRVPDHLRVGATWWNGRQDGQVDGDERGAQWLVQGTGEDAFDVEAELTAIGPGDGGLGVAVYRWATDGLTPPKLIVAAVSRPVSADAPTTPTLPTATRPAPTPTVSAVRIFLPVTLAEACLAGPPADIVVVADATTSMAERLPGGGTKREAVAGALAALSGGLRDGGIDRLALVTFARIAEERLPFAAGGDDGAAASAYLAAPLADGEAVEAGITVGAALLAGPGRRAAARGVLIVVTDGRIESGGAARAAAEAAKATGIVIVTAGIGPELNRPLLVAIASSPDHASFSADQAALLRIFGRLPERLKCERTAFWSGRAQ